MGSNARCSGTTHSSKFVDQRLSELEVSLFGKAHSSESQAERVAAITKSLNPTGVNLLMPAIAPQMDTTQSRSSTIPQRATALDDANDARQDQAKGELRKAMELYSKGDTAQAEQSFRRVLSIDSRNSDAYYNLGVIQEGRGDFQGALSSYKSALNINPSDNDLRGAVASVQGKIDQEAQASRKAAQAQNVAAKQQELERTRQSLQQYTTDASAAFKAGNYDKAIGDLQFVAKQAPTDPDVQYALSQAYRGKGDIFDARTALNRAITIDPSNQLYKGTLTQLDQQIAQGGASSAPVSGGISTTGMPATAPDFRSAASAPPPNSFSGTYGNGNYGNGATPGSVTGFTPADNSGQPTGQLTPFSDSGMANLPSQRGYAYSGGGYGGMGGGYGSSSGSSRLQRTAVAGLGGAAIGAVMSSMFAPPGYRGRSMMRGAMMGGAMGLITGGLFSH